MTIVWPVVGGEGDGALRITNCGASTVRAALSPLAPPPGAAAMTPVTIVPPGRASSKACDCKGASGLRSSPGGAQVLEEQEERPKEVLDPAGTHEEE